MHVVLGRGAVKDLLAVYRLVITLEQEASMVHLCDIKTEMGELHLLNVVFERHEILAVVLVTQVVCLLPHIFGPKVTRVAPGTIVLLTAPRVSDADESVLISVGVGDLKSVHDREGVSVGQSELIRVLVAPCSIVTPRCHHHVVGIAGD